MLYVFIPYRLSRNLSGDYYVLDTDDLSVEQTSLEALDSYFKQGIAFANLEKLITGRLNISYGRLDYVTDMHKDVVSLLNGRINICDEAGLKFGVGTKFINFFKKKDGTLIRFDGKAIFFLYKTKVTKIGISYVYMIGKFLVFRCYYFVENVVSQLMLTLITDMDGVLLDTFIEVPLLAEYEKKFKSLLEEAFLTKFMTFYGRRY